MRWRAGTRPDNGIIVSIFARHHRVGQVSVANQGVVPGFEKLVMPPFLEVAVPAGSRHEAKQRKAVLLGLPADFGISMMGKRCKGIERGSHFQFLSLLIDQGQVNGGDGTRVERLRVA